MRSRGAYPYSVPDLWHRQVVDYAGVKSCAINLHLWHNPHGMAGGVPGAIGAAVAPAMAARLLTSKRFVTWLSKTPTSPGALSRHLGRLAVMAEGDDDVRAFAGVLGR